MEQLRQDKTLVTSLIDGNLQVIDDGNPDRKNQLIAALERITHTGRRRGGPTRYQLLQLRPLVPGLDGRFKIDDDPPTDGLSFTVTDVLLTSSRTLW